MKIAITLLKYNPFGGYERQAAALAEGLAARGDEVTIFSHTWKEHASDRIKFEKVPVLNWTPWLRVLSFALMSRRYLRRHAEKFDLVIAFDRTLEMDIYRAGNACHREWIDFRKKHLGLSSRLSIAINPLHPVMNWIEKRIFGHIQNKGGYIVGLAPLNSEQVRKHYSVAPERFYVIPSTVDLERFNREKNLKYKEGVRDKLGVDDEILLLLHVGSGFRIKGLISTIRATALLLDKGRKVKLVIAGKDRKRTAIYKKLCRKLGVEQHVIFLGGVENIEQYHAAADIFVLPSLFETFCISAVEALASGMPVIIGKGAGASSIIEPVGKVIDVPASPEELAGMIEETAKKEFEMIVSRNIEAAHNRRREAASQCGLDNIMACYFELIDRVVKEKNARD